MDIHEAYQLLNSTAGQLSTRFQQVPGSAILLRYIKSSYQNDPVRSVVELGLFLFAVRYLLAPRYSTNKSKAADLTEEEIDELVQDWTPEPLVTHPTELEAAENEKRPVIVGPTGPKVKLANGRTVNNYASFNFFNFVSNEILKERAIQILRNYGVGACGPPNFYGTQDVHMDTERDIANFLGVPSCIVYAQALSTISSVIPAFSKRGDIIVADKAVNYSIQKGLDVSRSTVRWFEHNDLEDLERVLEKVQKEMAKKPLTRRFIVTEGLFETTGDMVDLPKIIELKQRYKFRLILDESHSFGILGRTGRGITEHLNVDPLSVDMLVGSLAHSICAGGGFCAGSHEIIEHQRISSSAYVFSAALPAILAVTASETIKLLENNSDVLSVLRENIKAFRAVMDRSEYIKCTSDIENPVCMFTLKKEVCGGIADQERLMMDIVDEAVANGVLISRVKNIPGQNSTRVVWKHDAAFKACISIGHTKKETEKAAAVVKAAVSKVVTRVKKENASKFLS
ncbi:pyridoxal phosphate-dependent transferase [Morchella snyderi]|nr:pyridoxal phosphate-dependent transferase [Morchella snyderi]